MACWECLLSPQCVFTEPNSFLGRNGASLRNMCTTHLLLLLPPSLPPPHTHTHTLQTSQTSGIRGLAQSGDVRKQQHLNVSSAPLCLKWGDQVRLKIKEKSRRGWRLTYTDLNVLELQATISKTHWRKKMEKFLLYSHSHVSTACDVIKERRQSSRNIWKLSSNPGSNKERDWTIWIHWEMLTCAVSVLFEWVPYHALEENSTTTFFQVYDLDKKMSPLSKIQRLTCLFAIEC